MIFRILFIFFALVWGRAFAGVPVPTIGSWPTFGNGPSHAGYYPVTIGTGLFTAGWSQAFTLPINQVVAAEGRVFYTTNGYFNDGMHAGALSEATGELLWQYPLPASFSVNPPTYADGKLYFQRGKNSYDFPQLFCLDAVSGSLVWVATFNAQWERYMAPAVYGDSVWVNGGTYGGLYEFDSQTGEQRFFVPQQQYDSWTPSYADGVTYSWVNGDFKATSPLTGSALWSSSYANESTPYSVGGTIAIADGCAFVIGNSGLRAIDLATRQQRWMVPGTFTGTPAVEATTVYALCGGNIFAYSAATGQLEGAYESNGGPLLSQPLITKDRVLAASETATFIFDRDSRTLLQTLPAGGLLGYASGRLYVTTPFQYGVGGQISTYTVQSEDPDPSPTPVSLSAPTPTATPPPTPTAPSPSPSPNITPTPTPIPVATPFPIPPVGNAGSNWLDAQQQDGVAYFLFDSRIERFDLVNQTWLEPVTTPVDPKAFVVDSNGLYVGTSTSVWRLAFGGTEWSKLLNTPYAVTALLLDEDVLYVINNYQVSSVNKTTGRLIDSKVYSYALTGVSIARERNVLLGRSQDVSPSDIVQVRVDSEGKLDVQRDSPYHGDYPGASRTFVSPNEQRVADDGGIVYNTDDLSYAGSLAGAVQDLTFYGDLPIAIRSGSLLAFSNTFLETGRVALPGDGATKVFVQDDTAFVFYHADTRGVWALPVPLGRLNPATPGQAVDPNGLVYTPDELAFGDGVVYLLSSQNLSVFRWSVANEKYLPTIALTEAASHLAFSSSDHRLYVGYPSGRITYFANGMPERETAFVNLPGQVRGLASAGQFVFAVDPTGAWATHYTFSSVGSLLSQKDWSYLSSEYIWSAANQKMYFLRDDTSPNDILSEVIDGAGVLGAEMDSPYHTSTGIAHPVRVSPDGQTVLLGSGRMFDGSTLNITGRLPFMISDAVWVGSKLYTLSDFSAGTELHLWSGNDFVTYRAKAFTGTPLRLFDTGQDLLVVTLVEGKPKFSFQGYDIAGGPIIYPTPTPAPTPAPMAAEVKTGLTMLSQSGDYIGQGQSYLYIAPAATFSISKNYAGGASIYVSQGGDSWSLDFAALNGFPLTTRTYSGAVRFPFQGPNQPGLDISGQGRGSNELTGSFTIKQIVYADEKITAFWATFEQHSEGGSPALTGEVRINAEDGAPTPEPEPSPTPKPTASATPTPSAPTRPAKTGDTKPPRVKINGGQEQVTRLPFVILNGTASDNRAVKRVEIKMGNGRYVPAGGSARRWYQLLDLKLGGNVFWVRAWDHGGNYSPPKRVVVIRE